MTDKLNEAGLPQTTIVKLSEGQSIPIAPQGGYEHLRPSHMDAHDGTVRKSHYGSGVQPWDEMKVAGLAGPFAACNVLKYLRRVKEPIHSLQSAQWYATELIKLPMLMTSPMGPVDNMAIRRWLAATLTPEEHIRLGVQVA